MTFIDTEKEDKEILNKYRNLLRACSDKTDKEDKKNIRKAFNLLLMRIKRCVENQENLIFIILSLSLIL